MKSAKIFYENIESYHDKIEDVISFIMNFYTESKIKPKEKIYTGIRFENGEIAESNLKLSIKEKQRIENWINFGYKIELKDSIYKIDVGNKIFIFKIFTFKDGNEKNSVLAGYILEQSYELRSYILDFRTKKLAENIDTLLSIA